jgi:hypothetical protein
MTLATPEAFAAFRGVTYDPTDVQAILALSNAEALVRTYCDQSFDLEEDDIVLLDGTGTRSLLLPQLPAIGVTSVSTFDDDDIETQLDPTDYVLAGDNGILWRTHRDAWPRGIQNISVTYDHGFETLPSDLLNAIMVIASRGLSSSAGGEVQAEAIGTYSVTYADSTSGGGLQDGERLVLDRYRQQRVA